ncbi:MAG: hypothetical protein CMP42_02120 [Rickettsiales bacterium]|nr:hypothetical protein [Rickettsiales bacterium]
MKKIFIDYGDRINTAILGVVKDILKDLSDSKISSNHCFYISFKTKDKNVKISDNLKKEYPNEMTIVLQNQFWNLVVKKNSFSVTLSFNKKKESLEIPYKSVTKFYDPFVKFSIQLDSKEERKKLTKTIEKNKQVKDKAEKIITLDDFRKK